MGMARQWCGQLGNVESCHVGVFAAPNRGPEVTLIDERLFLPEAWTNDPTRCQAAGIPKAQRSFQRKTDLALAMIAHARQQSIGFAWVGFDVFHGGDPAFPRTLNAQSEVFVGDVHKAQRMYLDDPGLGVPPDKTVQGRPPTRLQARTPAVRVDHWVRQQPAAAWQPVTLRNGTKGPLRVKILRRRMWLWAGEEPQARPWHLIVRRESDAPTEIKYNLSNAPADTPAPRLVPIMQGQRSWIERALQQGKQDAGLGDYPVRGWRGWHHHLAQVMMADAVSAGRTSASSADLTVVERSGYPSVVEPLLPQQDTTLAELLRQIEVRHRKRQSAINSAYRKQNTMMHSDRCSDKVDLEHLYVSYNRLYSSKKSREWEAFTVPAIH